jgi:hypothetical protein
MRRIPIITATVIAVAITISASPVGAEGGANNVVIANNTVDGSAVARDRLQVAHDTSSTVGNENVAIAQSQDCVACRTVSVAMQVVIVQTTPTEFHPANAASAANGGCDSCQTYAFAYQDIVQPGFVVYLSGAAQQHLAQLRSRIDAIATDTTLSFLDMKAQLDSVFDEVVATVRQDMQAAGADGTSDVRETSKVA